MLGESICPKCNCPFPTQSLKNNSSRHVFLSDVYKRQLLGRGEKEAADKVASTALYSSLFVGAAMILCSLIFLKPILKLLGATESILPYAVTYTAIYVTSSIFNIFNVTMNNIVTSEGAAKTTMCALLTGCLLYTSSAGSAPVKGSSSKL